MFRNLWRKDVLEWFKENSSEFILSTIIHTISEVGFGKISAIIKGTTQFIIKINVSFYK